MCNHLSSRLQRRQALALLVAPALAGRVFGDADLPLDTSGLDHVAIAVSDVERSVAFYSGLFSGEVLKDNKSSRHYFRIGNAYIAIAPPAGSQKAGRVDHFCPGIAGFDTASVKRSLDQRGIPSREVAVGMYVADPDGIQVQLWTSDSWKQVGRSASPSSSSHAKAWLRPIGLDHVLLAVSDPEKAAGFYERLFGPAQRGKDRIWFNVGNGRIGLASLRPGRGPGVDHFCVKVDGFDPGGVQSELQSLGAVPQIGESPNAPEFLDPDGVLLQIIRA